MITGIIMASGFSKRMNKDKLTLDFFGMPILENVIRAVKNSYVDHILMIYREKEVKKIGIRNNIQTIYNEKAKWGQSESIKLGIKFSPKGTKGYMFFVGDQPFLKTHTINQLIHVFKEGNDSIVLPQYNGTRGNPVIFSSKFKNELLMIKGDEGGRSLIKKYDAKIVHIPSDMEGKDIDTWDEYMKWR